MSTKMTTTERRSISYLSLIMALRMIGLFMVLPVFSLYAYHLTGATPTLVGIAMGIYGLSQALFQIPFGSLSDRFGRKPIILFGLSIFILGSLLSGFAHSIVLMTVGRALQGAGAVGSSILALMADLTREDQRTKAMAIAGMTIGFSFSAAILLGPFLTQWMNVNHLFFVAAFLGMIGISLLYTSVPTPAISRWHRDTQPEWRAFLHLLTNKELIKLNCGIFILHALFTASFVALPLDLSHYAALPSNKQWYLYLPALISALFFSLLCIGLAERRQQIKPYFLGGIGALCVAELLFWQISDNLFLLAGGLCLFFSGFSLLEAFLPSLISRAAPATRKGSALGIYSSAQFLGIFIGGTLGGWLYGRYNLSGVYLFCIALAFFWLALAFFMQPPRFLVTQMLKVFPHQQPHWESVLAKLQIIPGMVEITFIAEDGIAYLKMERATTKHPDFIQLKEQLQSE